MPTAVRRALARLLLVLVTLVGFGALASTAQAQPHDFGDCASSTGETTGSGVATAAATTTLLPPDGVGFFGPHVDRVVVQRSGEAVGYLDAATEVQTQLSIAYARRGMVALDSSRVAALEPGAIVRIVVIDGDVALPGEPAIVELDGVRTLFLHWTTALEDLNKLLDVPEFEAMSVGASDGATDNCHLDETAFDRVADDLAFIEAETASGAEFTAIESKDGASGSSPIDDVVRSVPLGDTSTNEKWPYKVAGAAVLAAAGAVVLYRRDNVRRRETQPTPANTPTPTKPDLEDRPGDSYHAEPKRSQSALNPPVDRPAPVEPAGLAPAQNFSTLVNEESDRHRRGGLVARVADVQQFMGESE